MDNRLRIAIIVFVIFISVFLYYSINSNTMIGYEKIRISKFGVNINSAYAGTYPFKLTSVEGKTYYIESFEFSEFLRNFENKPFDVELSVKKKRRFPSHFFKPADVIVGAEVNTNDLLDYYANQDVTSLRGVISSSNNKIFTLTKLVSYGITKENSESSTEKSKEISILLKGSEIITNSGLFNNSKSEEIIVRGKLRNAMTSTRALDGVSDSSLSDYELEISGWYFVKGEEKKEVKIDAVEPFTQNNMALIPVYTADPVLVSSYAPPKKVGETLVHGEAVEQAILFLDERNENYYSLSRLLTKKEGRKSPVTVVISKLHFVKGEQISSAYIIVDIDK